MYLALGVTAVTYVLSLVIFLLVGISGYRRRAETGSSALVVLAAIAVTAVVLAFFAVDTLKDEPETFVAIVAIAVLSILLDALWKRGRDSRPQEGAVLRARPGDARGHD